MEDGSLDGGVYIPNTTREIKVKGFYDKNLAGAPQSPRQLRKVVFFLQINVKVRTQGGSPTFKVCCDCDLFKNGWYAMCTCESSPTEH